MALEQMRTFLAGGAQDALGGVTLLPPDGYPLLLSSELRQEHETISELVNTAGPSRRGSEIRANPTLLRMCDTDPPQRTRYALALIERIFAYDAQLTPREDSPHAAFFDYGPAAEAIAVLFDRGVEAEKLVPPLLEWFTGYRFNLYATPLIERAVEWIAKTYGAPNLPEDLRRLLIALRGQFSDVAYRPAQIEMALDHRTDLLKYPDDQWLESSIDALIGKGPWLVLVPCEVWTTEALEQLNAVEPEARERWFNLLNHCHLANSTRPSAKWLKPGLALLDAVGSESFVAHVLWWFARSNEGRVRPTIGMATEDAIEQQRMHELNAAVLRGLLWLCPTVARPEVIQAIGKLCFSAFRKVRGLGSRAAKVGNAGIYALGQIDHPLALGQLALLRTRVKLTSAQKAIEKAFTLTAERSCLSRQELEEMSVPAYGLTEVGVGQEKIGDYTARITITGTHSTTVEWTKPDGAAQRSVPARIKAAHPEEVQELQASIKDIHQMLPAQRERIESLYLQWRGWPISVWRERYLDHPLVGTLARRLLWEFTCCRRGEEADNLQTTIITAIWHDGQLVDIDLKPIATENASTIVQLWHPIGKDPAEIAAWRERLEAQQIQQPFKQAHREIYAITGAEPQSDQDTYSDRFAGHVLKHQQFHALCAGRGWKAQLLRMVEGEFPPPSLPLPAWGLRAEFSIEGIGHDYAADGADTTETGVYHRVSTGSVRFHRISNADTPVRDENSARATADAMPLSEIPPLVFSEVMREVDLLVAAASIGNDPAWFDGGPQGRHRNYWHNYAFGELNPAAITRKEALQRLLPRLKISSLCRFEDRFLLVQGSLRIYKIHLGSGNILMEPNNQFLCLAPKQNDAQDFPVRLPFEGDRTLSAIISKAFLLANDTKITDPDLVTQIMHNDSARRQDAA